MILLLRYVTFYVQVEIGLYVMSPTLESFNRILRRVYSNRVWIECAKFSLKLHKVFVQTFRCAVALRESWVCKYSIRFQVIKLKLLCETLKNEKWKFLAWYPVFLTQIISRWQKNADAKVVSSISCRQFSKDCVFPNIQLKGVVNRLPPFKNLSDHTHIFLMG